MTKTKKLTPTLLKSIEIEYMTTNLTIEELEAIYNVNIPPDNYRNWKKVPEPPKEPTILPDLVEHVDTTLELTDLDEIKNKIKTMKSDLLEKVGIRIDSLDEYSDIKDLKDLVSTLDMLEKSYDDKKTATNVTNITMQFAALISKYEQDC